MALPIQLPSFAFYERLSPRERVLTLIVGGAVFIVLNIVVLSMLLKSFSQGRRDYAEKAQQVKLQQIFASEEPMWKQRMGWVKTKQPPLANRDRAGTELLDQVQGVARNNQVILTNPQIKPAPLNTTGSKEPGSRDYQSVSVEVDTESDWGALVRFVQTLQKPEAFVVFDLATLRSDPGNATRMKGQFRISKWYAPAGK